MSDSEEQLRDRIRNLESHVAQLEERAAAYGQERPLLRRDKEALQKSNDRLTKLVGHQTDELVLLREERGGEAAARAHARKVAYSLVQKDLDDLGVLCVNSPCMNEWRLMLDRTSDYEPTHESLIDAVDAAKGGR